MNHQRGGRSAGSYLQFHALGCGFWQCACGAINGGCCGSALFRLLAGRVSVCFRAD